MPKAKQTKKEEISFPTKEIKKKLSKNDILKIRTERKANNEIVECNGVLTILKTAFRLYNYSTISNLKQHYTHRSPKRPSETSFWSRESPRRSAQIALSVVSKTFQASQTSQRTMSRPSNATVQSRPSNMKFILFNILHFHNGDRRTIREFVQPEASLVGPNEKICE